MSFFSYIDTRAPSTEEILKIENEYDDNGELIAPSWLDSYELQTEFSLQRLSSLFGTLSIVLTILSVAVTVWFSVRTADGNFSAYSAVLLLIGLGISAIVFSSMRLARAFVNYMLVRLLQTEED